MDVIMRLVTEKVGSITAQEWKNVCDHAVKEENKFKGHDAVLDDLSKRFIINTDDTSDESENDDKENDEDAMSDVEEF